jgi:hypothetical protein
VPLGRPLRPGPTTGRAENSICEARLISRRRRVAAQGVITQAPGLHVSSASAASGCGRSPGRGCAEPSAGCSLTRRRPFPCAPAPLLHLGFGQDLLAAYLIDLPPARTACRVPVSPSCTPGGGGGGFLMVYLVCLPGALARRVRPAQPHRARPPLVAAPGSRSPQAQPAASQQAAVHPQSAHPPARSPAGARPASIPRIHPPG